MPANARSLQITDTYRHHVRVLRQTAITTARREWQERVDLADLDGSHGAWVARVAPVLTELQRGGVRLSAAYLSAYLTSELGRRVPPLDAAAQAGVARDGRPLTTALQPSVFTVKQAIGEGHEPLVALAMGLNRASRLVGEEAVAPARSGLDSAVQGDERIIGWRRVSGGGCGACMAAATGAIQADDEVLEVHPHCSCTKEPVVADVADRVQRPTGQEIFEGLSAQEQDQLLGPDKAALIRSGDVPLHALIQRDPMAVVEDGITEAPLEALHT